MLDVPFSAEEESLARRRYEEARERCAVDPTTPDEFARCAEACVEVGAYALAFDTIRESHEAFGTAADAYLKSIEGRISDPAGYDYAVLPTHAWRGAYAALLAGDRCRARTIADAFTMAEQTPEPGVELADHPFYYAKAVTAAAAADDEDVLTALEETIPENPWAKGTTTLLRGAVMGDRDAIETGLDDLLERHRERVDDTGGQAPHMRVFASEPTALTLLAWERGLEYDPESRFVPTVFLRETLQKLS